MSIDGRHDLEGLQIIGAIVAEARDTMGAHVAPGVTTAELDQIGKDILTRHGARSAPQLAYGFPGTTCISVNDDVAHGIPSSQRVLRAGDLVNIDVSAELNGYWADTGASFAVGEVSHQDKELLKATRQALEDAMEQVTAGAPMNNIGRAVEKRAKRGGFRVIRNLCGHGVGRYIHEEPQVPNTFQPRDRTLLRDGWVITIEPFLTTRATMAVTADDGWTLRTPDGSRGAQFEHTMIVTRGRPIIVT
ncbi:type I methionyl aminopeptidase [Steroidobacter sp.]|uniref:type I methionyl aminopeptidase n=1 Tax=Steroidobacter sp. TaxID=1978227 RepID=UPI001A5CB6F0|nr:type I methionyl aminopeptidase [Steroidobacter sp.]MBL8270562.1 type I methionyl aminopeptidase [Steroidobacter sp.]